MLPDSSESKSWKMRSVSGSAGRFRALQNCTKESSGSRSSSSERDWLRECRPLNCATKDPLWPSAWAWVNILRYSVASFTSIFFPISSSRARSSRCFAAPLAILRW